MKKYISQVGKRGWTCFFVSMFLLSGMAYSAMALERLEPPEGCYFGVGIGFDSGEWDPIDTVDWWSERMGGLVAGAYEYFTDYPVVGQDLEKIESFMQQVIPYHGIAIITLRPFGGLSITNCSPEAAAAFGDLCARWEGEGVGGIMVRFGNEMNAGWFPWGQQPTAYRNAYRMLASNVHECTERTAMVWDPNEGAGFPWPIGEYVRIDKNIYSNEYAEMDTNGDGGLSGQDDMYAPFYPGDDAVDWVGMSSYHWGMEWPWGENEEPHTDKLVSQIRGLDQKDVRNFYDKYCRDGVHNKPLMISETAALFNADRTDGDSEYDVKSKWWEQLYNAFGDNTNCFDVAEHLPKLKMICWFDRICHETEINHDRIVWGFSTPSDIESGWVATNHTWLEDFEHLDSWWQPWDVTWAASDTVFCEGSNSLLLRGLSVAESNTYIGGCGRSIGDSFFDAKKTIAQFEGLHVNGWDGQPRATVEDFEIPAAWNGIPWISWTLTGDAKSGTNAICMSGPTQTSSNDYVGGNLRPIEVSVFQQANTLAEMQDLTAAPTNVVYTDLISVDPFESLANWHVTNTWNITRALSSERTQGSYAMVLTRAGALQDNGYYVGGAQRTCSTNWSARNGMVIWVKRASDSQTNPRLKIEVVDSGGVSAGVEREIVNTTYQPLAFTFDEFTTSGAFNWSSIAFLKVHLLPSIQWSNPAPIYVDNWNIANVSKQYPDEVDWNTSWGVTMSSVNDPSEGYSAKSMQLHGNATTGEGHIGGVRGTLRADCADWSAMEAMRITMRRGTNSAANPDFSMELKDTAGRSVFLGRLIETSDYVEYTIPKSDMSIASGFDWTQLDAIQINMGTTNIAVLPADIYVKKIELGTMVDASTISDWSDYDGVEIWARRETSAEPDPVLMLEVLSGTYTANAARTVSSKGVYEPLRIYCDDFSVDSGFSWANVTELRVGMLSTTNGVQPGDLCMDAWSVVATEKTLYDQDWWTPWVDTNDPTGTNEFEFKLESDAVIGGTNVLTLSGLDQDNATNSVYGYIGGSGFSVRAFECDWSDYTHFKITARRDSVGEANPVIQVTITDKNGKTAHIGRTVKNTGYLRQCCSFADMEPEAGFDWSAIEDVKFELLTDEAHATPGKLYIQDFVLGVMPNESPRDWTPFNGMELKIRRANETNTHPLLRVTVESEVGSITNTAYSFIAVRNTNDTFKAMR
ncbi:MAG: hypothetical protein PHP44_04140, partial [Kiritimatiellae bacterium]|nr:hypothetical protein [Kiritimatiellia bacterium]